MFGLERMNVNHRKLWILLSIPFLLVYISNGLFEDQSVVHAAGTPVATVTIQNWWIPQNKDTSNVSTTKWSKPVNAVYDSNALFKPYSNWPSIDYTNSTGKATGQDRVLRQAEVRIYVLDSSTGSPLGGQAVTLSTTLGSNAFVKNPNSTTNSSGITTGYIEFYGTPTFQVTATVGGVGYTSSSVTAGRATYYNKFFITKYRFALWSKQGSQASFQSDVCMQGSGYDDRSGEQKWYRAVVNSDKVCTGIALISQPVTKSGTYPTMNRTIAVDSPYITRNQYLDNAWYRGKVWINGLSNSSGDSGYRTAEDSGGAINGYHIDIFMGYQTLAEFNNQHTSLPTDTGEHFSRLDYVTTLRTVLE